MDNDNQEQNLAIGDQLIRDFVGTNADYYLTKWKAAKDPNRRAGWNWSAFFGHIG